MEISQGFVLCILACVFGWTMGDSRGYQRGWDDAKATYQIIIEQYDKKLK